MAKVLFINPVVRQEDSPRHVPYGIALLAALAMQKGHLVQVYDENAWRQGDDIVRQAIEADDWDVIAAGGITTTYANMKKLFQMAETYAPDAIRVMGGGILTAMPRDIMTLIPQVQIGVVGEAFISFNELLAQVDAGQLQPAKLKGIIFRAENGELCMTEAMPLLQDLDSLPYPAHDLFPLEEVYFKNSEVLFSEEGMTARRRLDINASYGCSLVCKFCFHLGIAGDMKYVTNKKGETDVVFDTPGSYKRIIRYHSPKYVVDMVKHLQKKFDIDFVAFLDENLMTMDQSSNRTWLNEICDRWIGEGLQPQCVHDSVEHSASCRGVHWSGTSHATLCNPKVLTRMRQAGCSHLLYGYESFSPQVLRRLGKGATRETNLRSFAWTMESGIRPIPNQMMGFPTEDFQSLRDCMDAWKELNIVVKPFFATPYPGSFWYEVYKDRILEQYDGNLDQFLLHLGDATEITALICENFNAVELYGLRELMVRQDYKRLAQYEQEWNRNHGENNAQKKTDELERRYAKDPPLALPKGSAAS